MGDGSVDKKPETQIVYPDVVYHYTNFDSLLNILSSKSLLASNINYLNDEQEYIEGIPFILSAIENAEYAPELEPIFRKLLNRFTLEEAENSIAVSYIVSFSYQGDLLSQWRGYSPNGGVSLGINFESLSSTARAQGFHLAPCLYSEVDKNESARQSIVNIVKFCIDNKDASKDGLGYESDWFYDFAVEQLMVTLSLFKHESFNEEVEVRLIGLGHFPGKIKYRSGPSGFIPYRVFDFIKDESKIKFDTIIMSPGNKNNKNKLSILMALEHLGYEDTRCIVIKNSSSTYVG